MWKLYENKFKLRRLDITQVGMPKDCKLYINQNLCKRLKSFHCQRLLRKKNK